MPVQLARTAQPESTRLQETEQTRITQKGLQKVTTNRAVHFLLMMPFLCTMLRAQAQRVSLCLLEKQPEKFVNSQVEVQGLIFAGVEFPRIRDGRCSFRFARGNDYQAFEHRFPITENEQWKSMKKILATAECASNVRVVKARIVGTVIRAPATGTIPDRKMPFELVIQSVFDVSRVPVYCTSTSSSPAVVHENAHGAR
jgi:hypothetical protein